MLQALGQEPHYTQDDLQASHIFDHLTKNKI